MIERVKHIHSFVNGTRPDGAAELDDYVEAMRPRLSVNAQTREFLDFLMTSPFLPDLPEWLDRQLHRFTTFAGMSRAPRWAQELIGYDRPPAATRTLMGPMLRLDAQRLRWAFGMPRYLQLASERVAGAGRPEAVAS